MSEFVEHLHSVFAEFGPITVRRMFGGYGLYHEGLMFALVADDVLYLKADQKSTADFIERNLAPFRYDKNGKQVQMSYYLAPEEIYDDVNVAKAWANRAFEAALRSSKPKK